MVVAADAQGLLLWDAGGALLYSSTLAGVRRVAVGQERILALRCADGACAALAWYPAVDQWTELGEAGEGGALVEADGVAWWGDPQLEDAKGTGSVCSEEGTCLQGLEGDHLGRELCRTHAAGVFNKWIVPARMRIVPLAGGPTLAVERAAPSRPPALDSDGSSLAIGISSYGLHERNQGRVLLADLEDL